jgi:hypothetical protein
VLILISLSVPLQHFSNVTAHKYEFAIFGALESVPITFEIERFHFHITNQFQTSMSSPID